jgi:hypothetical protein
MAHTFNGKTLTVSQWAKEPEIRKLGITAGAIYERLRGGWSIEETLTIAKGGKRESVEERLENTVRPKKTPKRATKPAAAEPRPVGFRVVALLDELEIESSDDPEVWRDTVKRMRGARA